MHKYSFIVFIHMLQLGKKKIETFSFQVIICEYKIRNLDMRHYTFGIEAKHSGH